jgi:replicative DNA helicase
MVIVDHIQLMRSGQGGRSRYEDMTEVSRQLKQLALKERVIMLLLSQLNRAVESRQDKRPNMADLRDSGAAEEDADQVWLMYREDYYREREPDYVPTGICEIEVAKQRNGPTGPTRLRFLKPSFRFEDITEVGGGLRG